MTSRIGSALGGKYLISYRVGIAFLPVVIVTPAISEQLATGDSHFWRWVTASALATLICVIAIITIDKLFLQRRFILPYPYYAVFIAGFFFGFLKGALNQILADGLLHAGRLTLEFVVLRGANAALLGIVSFPLISSIAYSFNELSKRRRNSFGGLAEIERVISSGDNEDRSNLIARAEAQLSISKRKFERSIEYFSFENADLVARTIERLAEEVVRPLSHSVAPNTRRGFLPFTSFRDGIYLAPTVLLRSLPWITAFYGLSEIRNFIRGYGFTSGLLFLIIDVSLLVATLYLEHLVLVKLKPSISRVALTFLTFLFIYAYLRNLIIHPFTKLELYWNPAGNLIWVVFVILFTNFSGMWVLLQNSDQKMASSAYQEKYYEMIRKDYSQKSAEYQLARYLHGTLQTRLLASAFRLRNLPVDSRSSNYDDEIEKVLSHFDFSGNRMYEYQNLTLSSEIVNLIESWDGLLNISTKIEVSDGEISDKNTTAIRDILEEALANAFRHGKATEIIISIHLNNQDIVITSEDNGSHFRESKLGMGSKLFESATKGHWSLKRNLETSQTIFSAHLNLGQ